MSQYLLIGGQNAGRLYAVSPLLAILRIPIYTEITLKAGSAPIEPKPVCCEHYELTTLRVGYCVTYCYKKEGMTDEQAVLELIYGYHNAKEGINEQD